MVDIKTTGRMPETMLPGWKRITAGEMSDEVAQGYNQIIKALICGGSSNLELDLLRWHAGEAARLADCVEG
jgi:hypothetical protein